MPQHSRPEPKILHTRLIRDADGRLQVEPRGDVPKTTRPKWLNLRLSKLLRRPHHQSASVDVRAKLSRFKSLPAVTGFTKRLARKLQRWPRSVYGLVGIAVVLLLAAGGGMLIHNRATSPSVSVVQGAQTATGPMPGTPNYATVLPGGKSAQSLGGWYRVSPPTSDPVYAFSDHIGAVQLDVSEQPLPASFRQNTAEQIAQLAQGFGANEKIASAQVTFYIGTSAKGPQSVILTKNDLLILIKSTGKLTTDAWITYLSSLQ